MSLLRPEVARNMLSLDILQNNINMMESTMDLVEDFVNFGTKQASLVFGENSALTQLILSGFGPLIENIDSIFNALESLINFKRNILDAFLSENYDREKLLRKFSIQFIDSCNAALIQKINSKQ